MGRYINEIDGKHIGITANQKCISLLKAGAEEIKEPAEFEENIVCVVDNGHFGAAAWAYDQDELDIFRNEDGRPRRWFIFPGVEKHVD